ncbi:MAG: hypothetical protein AVDCRST_MAG78-1982, partial [uncultured Rubrobacteraceae bacterium]
EDDTKLRVPHHPGIPVGHDDPVGRHRARDVHGVSQHLPRSPSVAQPHDGVHGRQQSGRLLPALGVPLLAHRDRGSDPELAREGGSLLDLVQPAHDHVRGPGFDGLLLAPEHDHVRGGNRRALGCLSQASRPRVPDVALVEARVQRGGFRVDLRGLPEVLPAMAPVPVHVSRGV